MSVEVVSETHAASEDTEAGTPASASATCGGLKGPDPVHDRVAHIEVPYPGGDSWRQAVERVAGF